MNIQINSVRPLRTPLDNRINRANRFYYHGKLMTVNNEWTPVSEHNERKCEITPQRLLALGFVKCSGYLDSYYREHIRVEFNRNGVNVSFAVNGQYAPLKHVKTISKLKALIEQL